MGIVKFKSKAAADIVMLKPHAEKLFSIMGIPLEEQGVIQPAQLPNAIAPLQAAIDQEKSHKVNLPKLDETALSAEEKKLHADEVGLEQRAYPLLKMLEAANSENQDVHWGF